MNQKFKNLGKLVLILCVTLLSTNCSNDELSISQSQSNIQTVTIDEAKSFLTNSNVSPLAKSSNKKSDDLQYDQIVQEKINGSDQLLTIIPFETNNNLENDRILLLKIDNEIKSVIFSMYPDENSIRGSFSGKIFIYSLEGFFLNGYRAENGIIVSQFVRNNTKASATSKQDAEALKEVIVKSNTHGIKYVNYLDFEAIWGSGGSSNAGGGQGMSWDAGMGDGGYGNTTSKPVQIIDELTGKAKCLNALLNKNGNSFVQKLLANFTGTSKFDINIISLDKVTNKDENGILREVNGKTTHKLLSTRMTIEISTSRTNTNAGLEAARTILHEYIHADMYRKITLMNEKDKSQEVLDFKNTYEAYENSQHSTMAVLYLNSMKEALMEFHKTVLIDDYRKYTNYYGEAPTDAFYEAMAWGGLRDNKIKAWANLPSDKKVSIEALANRVNLLSKTVPCPN
ncbi:hypothetical protein [Flavobacterium sp. N1736]|uniref:hypothetical protein n=1 Tax=Flavobacterium sp. N1736 TaxID=2986823 RepID=UPI002225799C|nr:hypothetical protein [Flavobacterium sp. N1736]